MKKEIFEQAQNISTRIMDVENAIDRIESNRQGCGGFPININFCFDEDSDELKKAVVKHLKAKKDKLNKEFDNLK
jgi:hypothetical protein